MTPTRTLSISGATSGAEGSAERGRVGRAGDDEGRRPGGARGREQDARRGHELLDGRDQVGEGPRPRGRAVAPPAPPEQVVDEESGEVTPRVEPPGPPSQAGVEVGTEAT